MRSFHFVAILLLLSSFSLFGSPAAFAHDLGKMEQHINEAEPYTQIVSKPAPDFTLQTADGGSVSLQDFGGKSVVMYFLYARCKDECPLHSVKIKQVQEQVAEAGLESQIQFVAIATDTEDAAATAELMLKHPQTYGLDTANWVFLFGGAGREDAGTALAKAYTLEFTPVGESTQIHGIVTHVIDPQGRLRARYHGLDFDSVSLVSYAAALAHGDHGAAGDSQVASRNAGLTPLDWMLSALGLLSLVVLVWAAWTYLIPKGTRRQKAASTEP
ncbi:MAG: SCO family protein [Gammaproteobacteria bacterium]|nr:SCO family protein [Gammaproteobacteria bacterium]